MIRSPKTGNYYYFNAGNKRKFTIKWKKVIDNDPKDFSEQIVKWIETFVTLNVHTVYAIISNFVYKTEIVDIINNILKKSIY